jgi:hypothetical protein
MQVIIWGVTIVRADAPAGETILWGLRFWAAMLPIAGAWCSVAVLMSSIARAPMIALLMTGATFFILFFAGLVIGKGGDVQWLRYLYPNNFDSWIISGVPEHVFGGLGVCFCFMVVTSALGATTLATRDV